MEEDKAEGATYFRRVLVHTPRRKEPRPSHSAKIEAEVSQLEDAEKEFLEAIGLKETGLDRLILQARLLDLITYFTAGPMRLGWTKNGSRAPRPPRDPYRF